MKSLNLSGIAAFVLIVLLYSCEKDTRTALAPRSGPASTKIDPTLDATFNPDPATVNQTVTVTGKFDGATAIPDCGKLQLFQKENGAWVKVADADVSSSAHEVTYTFTPTIAGDNAYEFYVHYIASGGCDGFSENK